MPASNMNTHSPTRGESRRLFLKRTASGAAGVALASPLIVPNWLFGANPPSGRITMGFIGTGRQAMYANIPGFLRQPDAQVVAVCDVDSWRLERAQQAVEELYGKNAPSGKFNGCSKVADWRELIARRDVDAVMISTPDHWHVPIAIAALRAGKDVSCEKPLTRSVSEGRKLVECVAQHNRVFCTDSEFRSERMFHKAAQLVRNGQLGKLRRIITATPKDTTLPPQPDMPVPPELNYDMWLGPAPEKPYTEKRVHPRHEDKGRPGWITIRDYADGMLANWGAHLNDIAMWGNNTERTGPVLVEATGTFPSESNLWNVILEFEARFSFANGVELVSKTDQPYIRFEGSEGWVQVDYPSHIEVEPESLLTWEPGPNDVRLPKMVSEKRDFLDAVKARRQPQYDAEGGHRVASLSHLALASIRLGRKLKWDPAAERVIDDAEANKVLEPAVGRKKFQV